AVFFWRYTLSNAKAVYGRLPPPPNDYSKDFLQSPSNQWPIIDRVLGRVGDGTVVELTHKWPSGEVGGQWRIAPDGRGQYAWRPSSSSPLPWRLGDPTTDPGITFEGDPSTEPAAEATVEIETFLAKG